MILTDKELNFIAGVLSQLSWKTGQSEMAKMAEIIIEKINRNKDKQKQ